MEDLELEKPAGSEPTTPNSEHGSGPGQQLCIAAVQLKIVGESLGILQDFGQRLELVSLAEHQTCRVSFKDGTCPVSSAWIHTLYLQRRPQPPLARIGRLL